jgi:CTP synthase (UTP-ammonia lyase)
MRGALIGIQYARENNFPFIGTCGGFQHAVIEYARNVLKMEEVMNDNFDPYSPNNIITPLSCSLIGQTKHIRINQNSFIHNIYGIIDIEEKYNCSFGLNLEFQKKLDLNGFKISAVDEDGEVRILVLEGNKFYVATLFQPQLSSTYDNPHPLILAYLSAFNN